MKTNRNHLTSEDSRLLLKNIIWNSVGSLIYLGLQWFITIIVTRVLGYDDNGLLSLAMSASNVIGCLALYGMRNFQVSDIQGKYQDNDYIMSRIFTCIAAIVCCIIFVLMTHYDSRQKLCIIIYMIFKISECLSDVYHGIIQKNHKMKFIGFSLIIRGILSYSLFSITIIVTENLLFGLCILSFSSLLSVFLFDRTIARKMDYNKLKASIKNMKQLLIECAPLPIYTALFTAISFIPKHFIELNLGNESLGIYAAIATPTLIIQAFSTYIFSPLMTSFAECITWKDKQRFKNLFIKVTSMIGLLTLLSLIGYIIAGKWGLSMLYGKDILVHFNVLHGIVWCTILTAWVWYFSALLIVIREFRKLIFINTIAILICGMSSNFLTAKLGLNGASIAYIIPLLIELVLLLYCFIKKTKRIFIEK